MRNRTGEVKPGKSALYSGNQFCPPLRLWIFHAVCWFRGSGMARFQLRLVKIQPARDLPGKARKFRIVASRMEIRRQGFSGAGMLPYSELEYGGIVRIREKLESRFTVRAVVRTPEPVAV